MKDQQKSKRQFFGILVVSWVLMLIFAALYVQQLQKEKAWKEAGELDLCQYFEHKKLKGYADFFNSSSSFCCGVI